MSTFYDEVSAALARNREKTKAGCLSGCRWWTKGNRWWHAAGCPNNVGLGKKHRPSQVTEAEAREQDRERAALADLRSPFFPSREIGEEWAEEVIDP